MLRLLHAARLLLLLALGLTLTAGCSAVTASPVPTPDPRFALVTILSSQTHLVGNEVTVVGTLQNGDKDAHDISLHAQFFDPQGNALGSAQGVAEDVSAGGKKDFEIRGQVDPARYGTTQVAVASLGEVK
ncbi:MAG: FxLYD domain-containing protein [Chloroflexia bacterium]